MARLSLAVAVGTAAAGPLSLAAVAADPSPTSVQISQVPAYIYAGDSVTVTATVTPNPGGGTIWLSLGTASAEAHSIDPSTGSVESTLVPVPDVNGNFHVGAEFTGTADFAASARSSNLDIRYLPNAVITESPSPATSDTSAMIAFDVSAGVTTDCRLDNDPFAPCNSPVALSSLAEGHHTFDVKPFAADGRPGHMGSTAWFTDMTGPVPGDVTLDGGATTTNRPDIELDAPATDALSGIISVRVSSTGQTDPDGRLMLAPGTDDVFDRPWTNGSAMTWYVDPSGASGPRTVYVQWTDWVGNYSSIASRTIDVRLATVRLANGAWETASSTIASRSPGV